MITFNRECPTYDAVARFYIKPIGNFLPWKYVDQKRLDEILKECFRYGNPQTRNLIESFYDELRP